MLCEASLRAPSLCRRRAMCPRPSPTPGPLTPLTRSVTHPSTPTHCEVSATSLRTTCGWSQTARPQICGQKGSFITTTPCGFRSSCNTFRLHVVLPCIRFQEVLFLFSCVFAAYTCPCVAIPCIWSCLLVRGFGQTRPVFISRLCGLSRSA